jgi:hypothetical protein
MSYRRVIARRLHKRLSHHYLQADLNNKYEILLSTIIRDFGITAYAQLRDNLRQVEMALKEMQEKEVLLAYEIEKTFAVDRKNRIENAKFRLTPHPRFISEMKKANKRQKDIREYQVIADAADLKPLPQPAAHASRGKNQKHQ